MGRDRPTPMLSIPQWTPNKKLEWIRMLKSPISQCPYFRTLYDPASDELTEVLAQAHVEEDSLLSNKLLKQLDSTTKNLLSLEQKT
eukprot:10395070-Ditylum_brightwellii.AAC.1